jgi:hypothetical protein
MSGLKNRFPESVKQFWEGLGWYRCLSNWNGKICKKSHADSLHHILSSSSIYWIKGKHNESIYNSCPVNNLDCHIGKPMHNPISEGELLRTIKEIVDKNNYKQEDNDKHFLKIYARYY